MKQLIAILLLTIYAGSAAGVTVNYHYCCGHLANISILNFEENKGCACNPEDMPKDCCKDELKYQKGDDHRFIQTAQVSTFEFQQALAPASGNGYIFLPLNEHAVPFKIVNPPRSYPQPIFLLCNVFRI